MKPLIKWPGGKSREFEQLAPFLPPSPRLYVEPFLGGGALYFQLEPPRAVLNDTCVELMDLYALLAPCPERRQLLAELTRYVEQWERLPRLGESLPRSFPDLLALTSPATTPAARNARNAAQPAATRAAPQPPDLSAAFDADFLIDPAGFAAQLTVSLRDKLRRFDALGLAKGEAPELARTTETALRAGFYQHFRALLNDDRQTPRLSRARAAANFYFVREFCYGAMFRHNAQGAFNIPYGGRAYDRKDFRGKVKRLASEKVERLLAGAQMSCGDFEDCLRGLQPHLSAEDFIFCDPPYDTDFSRYDNRAFDAEDQRRLAACLAATPARFVLVIKDTPLIRELYGTLPQVRISSFAKRYNYNIKGRNKRDTRHLIISN